MLYKQAMIYNLYTVMFMGQAVTKGICRVNY